MEDTESYVICDSKARGFPIQYVSQGFQELFGYDAQECVGQRCNEVFGSAKLIKDKPSWAALNKVASQLNLSEEQATAAIKRMAQAADEAVQAASTGGTSQPVLLINSRKNAELFACEMSLCMNRHPTMGWEYHAGLGRDVSDLVSVAKLLGAAADGRFEQLCEEFRTRSLPPSGRPRLSERLAAATPELHAIAERMWKDELAKVFKPKDCTTTSAGVDTRSIWSRSTASTVQGRTKRSRIESIEEEANETEVKNIPHLGALFSQFTSEASEVTEQATVENPVEQEEPEQESSRFLDLLEGCESEEEEDEDSEGDERMAFLEAPAQPQQTSSGSTRPGAAELEPTCQRHCREQPKSDTSMEESDNCSTQGSSSPMSDSSMFCGDGADPVNLVSRKVLLDLKIPLVMAAPSAQGFPVVLRSAGFEDLPEPSREILLGSPACDALQPTRSELLEVWGEFCDAATEGHFHTHEKTGGGLAALEGFEDVVLPAGELAFLQPFPGRSGKVTEYLVYLKQVELDNCPFLLAVHTALPDTAAIPADERSRLLDSLFDKASTGLDDAISELASEFFYYAPMRRQRMRPKLPQRETEEEEA